MHLAQGLDPTRHEAKRCLGGLCNPQGEAPARNDAILLSSSFCGTIQLLFPFSLFSHFPAVAWSDLPSAFRGLACLLRGRVFSSRRGINLPTIPPLQPPSQHTASPASHSRLADRTRQLERIFRALSLPVQHLHLTMLPIVRFLIRWLGTRAR